VAKTSPEMRCFESLPPWSMLTTNDIEIFVESHFVTGPGPGTQIILLTTYLESSVFSGGAQNDDDG
jgi:hypothetical protein